MIKVGEHITLDIIGTTKEYDPSVYERVINEIAKAATVTKPKTRYLKGYMAKPLVNLRRWVSDRTFDRLLMSQFK